MSGAAATGTRDEIDDKGKGPLDIDETVQHACHERSMNMKNALKRAASGALACVVACAAPVDALFASGADPASSNRIFIASHRADWKFAPENSLASLENAIRFGVDIVETDVRVTKDGEFVVLHDPFVDRVTSGHGCVAELTLAEIKSLRLRDALGQTTDERIPTLREYMTAAKGRTRLYLDKAGQDGGALVPRLLALAKETGTLAETVFVLDWPSAKARAVFGDDLDKVAYCPVVEDGIPDLEAYVDRWLAHAQPFAFQFRFGSTDTRTFRLLPKILAAGSRAFVAATWTDHTAGHDDRASLLGSPDDGWGWLLDNGFTVIETNFHHFLHYYYSLY